MCVRDRVPATVERLLARRSNKTWRRRRPHSVTAPARRPLDAGTVRATRYLRVVDGTGYGGPMARKRDADESSSTPAAVIALLANAADGDTLFRDLYLRRARELLAPLFAESRYRSAAGERAEAQRCLQHARVAPPPRGSGPDPVPSPPAAPLPHAPPAPH